MNGKIILCFPRVSLNLSKQIKGAVNGNKTLNYLYLLTEELMIRWMIISWMRRKH